MGIALAVQHETEIVVRKRVAGIDLDGAAIGCDGVVRRCLGESSLSDQGRADIVVGFRRFRIDAENTLKLLDRLVEPALPLQRETKLDMRLRVAPAQADRLACTDRSRRRVIARAVTPPGLRR